MTTSVRRFRAGAPIQSASKQSFFFDFSALGLVLVFGE
jgi:hypothetical protein